MSINHLLPVTNNNNNPVQQQNNNSVRTQGQATEGQQTSRENKGTSMFLLIFSVWAALCSGSLYMFASEQTTILAVCPTFSASDVDRIYSAGQVGTGLSYLPGLVLQKYGAKYCALYCATLTFIGSLWLLMTLPTHTVESSVSASNAINGSVQISDQCSSPSFVAIGFFFQQHGSNGLYVNALFNMLKSCRHEQVGRIAGVLAAGNGLSSGFWNLLYTFLSAGSVPFLGYYGISDLATMLTAYNVTTGIIWTITGILQYLVYGRMFNVEKNAERKHRRTTVFKRVSVSLSYSLNNNFRNFQQGPESGSRATPLLESHRDVERNSNCTHHNQRELIRDNISTTSTPFSHTPLMLDQLQVRNISNTRSNEDNTYVPPLPISRTISWERSQNGTEEKVNIIQVDECESYPNLLLSPIYYSVFLQFIFINCIGSGLFIANLKLLSGSLNMDSSERATAVTLVSVFNTVGRLFAGSIMDIWASSIAKRRYFLISGPIMLLATSSIAAQPGSILNAFLTKFTFNGKELGAILVFCSVGFAFGCNWALLPAHMSEHFGPKQMNLAFSLPNLIHSGFVNFVSKMAGTEYDANRVHSSSTDSITVDMDTDSFNSDSQFCGHSINECFGHTAFVGIVFTSIAVLVGVLEWIFYVEWEEVEDCEDEDDVLDRSDAGRA